jgi:NAD(P)-dependent dehydrogenase (short-subunit alcohol dehydrogenase family)
MPSVLITGTSKGIGYEATLTFARAGYNVIAAMRNPSGSPELAQIAAKEKLPITVVTMDVDSEESVNKAFAEIQKSHGRVDVLVNNAGIERSGAIEELPLAEFRAAMETNYFGVIRCVQAVVPQMRKRGSGCIINISSVAGRISSSPLTAYMASKWALEALTESLAGEMKTFGVRVALVEPGIIDTAMARRISDQPDSSAYKQPARFSNLFVASLKNPPPPSLVAQKILEIAQGDTWQLRHPVGPDAAGFLGWRASMTDEDWVALNAADDETWYKRIESDFGMDTRPKA